MKTKLISVIVLALLFSFFHKNVQAQSAVNPIDRNKNTVYIEFLGNGILYSANYDRLLLKHNDDYFSFRAGVNFIPQLKNFSDYKVYGLILEPNYLFAINAESFFELGMSISLFKLQNEDYPSNLITFTPRIGYRYQTYDSGVFFRIGYTPVLPISADASLDNFHEPHMGYFAIGLGYTLEN